MTTLQTAECSRCHMHFKTSRGFVRFHYNDRRDLCPRSGLAPYVRRTFWDVVGGRGA